MRHLPKAFVVLSLAGTLGACVAAQTAQPGAGVPVGPTPLETKYYASDEEVQAGARHFKNGAFGLAQKSFQSAVEKAPSDAVAWMGLAASYDRLRRFDLADRAYEQAARLDPQNPGWHNNRGYSYLLRGDVVKAREHFMLAYNANPQEPTVANNLHLLDGSARHIRRQATAY